MYAIYLVYFIVKHGNKFHSLKLWKTLNVIPHSPVVNLQKKEKKKGWLAPIGSKKKTQRHKV